MESLEEGRIHFSSGTGAECLDAAGGRRCWDVQVRLRGHQQERSKHVGLHLRKHSGLRFYSHLDRWRRGTTKELWQFRENSVFIQTHELPVCCFNDVYSLNFTHIAVSIKGGWCGPFPTASGLVTIETVCTGSISDAPSACFNKINLLHDF